MVQSLCRQAVGRSLEHGLSLAKRRPAHKPPKRTDGLENQLGDDLRLSILDLPPHQL